MSKQSDSFSRFIAISAGFHLAIATVLTVKVLIFPSEIPDNTQAVRVDVVALPEKQIEVPKPDIPEKPQPVAKKPPPKAKPKPPKVKPKPKVPKPKKIALKKKDKKKLKDEQESALDRLKSLQKIKKQQAQKPKEFKGNQISKGNSLTGLAKLHHESYLDELDSHIRSFWNLPEWLASGNFKASVILLINKNGGISGKSFVLKSGNDLFDQHVLNTLEKANPLPSPPDHLINYYATKGVEVRFPE